MAFDFELRNPDGTPSPATLSTAVPNWRPGDVIPLAPGKTLRVVSVQLSKEPTGDPILVVEPA